MIYENHETILLLHLFANWKVILVKLHFIVKQTHRFRNVLTQLDTAKLL